MTSQIHPRRFTSPKQIQKLAGLEPKENSSGKHKGRTSISKRGRRKLRRLLFQAVLPLIRSNEDFREVYTYYSTRKDNPLKGTQAVIAVGCKLIRIFYVLLSHGADYSSTRFGTGKSCLTDNKTLFRQTSICKDAE